MIHRTTALTFTNTALEHSQRLASSIANYQRNISSGIRLHRPADEPIAFRQVTSLSARIEALSADLYTIKDAQSKLNLSVAQLTEAHRVMTAAKTLTQQGIQALDESERAALASEMEGLLQRMKDIALTDLGGAYIYGGTRADTPPFAFAEPLVAGGTLSSQYVGSFQASRAFIGPSVSIDTLYSGQDVFGPLARGATILLGKTGARTGQGTDNMVGRATLQVRHTATFYEPGSGVTAGSGSPGKDTILGLEGTHFLRIIDTSGDGSAGTISLNDGPAIPFTNNDTNLEVTGHNGQKVFVNTTNITPGFNGTVAVRAEGTLSVDGGMTTTAIDFLGTQTITDSTTGRFVHIDTTGITATGDDYLEFPGTSNAMQVLYEIIQDLRGARNLSNTEYAAALDRRLAELHGLANKFMDTVGRQSASLASLAQLDSRILDLQLDARERMNELQSTDLAETILLLKNDQTLLEYTYAVTAQISTLQLINFFR